MVFISHLSNFVADQSLIDIKMDLKKIRDNKTPEKHDVGIDHVVASGAVAICID